MSRLVDVIFSVKDEFSKPLENFNIALEDVGRQGKQVRKKIQNVGNDIADLGAGLTAGVTLPLAAMGTSAVKYAGDVSKSMELARATADQTEEEWRIAEEAAMAAAAAHTFTMEDASEATLNFARQGYDAARIANFMGATMDYAQGTGADLAESAAGIGNIMKGFQQEATIENVTDAFDQLAKAQSLANTDGSLLLEGVQRMAPIMATLGYDVGDAAALVGAWGDAGIEAAEAANTWKTSVMRMADPGKEGATAMERLGIAMFDAEGHTKDLVTLQRELHDAFADLSEQDAMAAASDIFGKNQGGKMLSLIQIDPDHLAELRSGIAESTETAQTLSEAMMESLGGSMESLASSIDVLKYSFGDLIGNYVQPIIEKITGLVDALNNLSPEQREAALRFAGIAAAVGPVLFAFGKIVAFVPQVMAFAAAVGEAGGLVSYALAAITSPAGIVVAALAGVVAAGVLIYKNWDTIKEKAGVVWAYVQGVFEKLRDKLSPITTALQGAFSTIADAFGQAKEELAPHVESLQTSFESLRQTLQPIFDSIGEFIGGVVSTAGELISTFTDGQIAEVAGNVTSLGDAIATGIGAAADIIGGVLDAITGLIDFINVGFTGDWEAAWKAAGDAFEPFKKVGEVVDSVLTTLKNMITYLTGTFKSSWESTWTAVEAVFKPIGESISGIVDGISSAIDTAAQGLAGLKNAAAEKWDNSALNWKNWGNNGDVAGNASGTSYWQGGPTRVNESGGEIINLPSGTQIIPHDASRNAAVGSSSVTIAKLADSIIVREDADIDRITDSLVRKLIKAQDNMGVVSPA